MQAKPLIPTFTENGAKPEYNVDVVSVDAGVRWKDPGDAVRRMDRELPIEISDNAANWHVETWGQSTLGW
jgi:hypothetical protein